MKTEYPKMKIVESALNDIISFVGGKPAESGGALFGDDDFVIRRFIPDTGATTTRSTYTIDSEYINKVIKKLGDEENLQIVGILHSHPQFYSSLSGPDRDYFTRLLGKLKREKFYAPIVHTVPDGGFKIIPHVLNSNGNEVTLGRIEIVYEDEIIPYDNEKQEPEVERVNISIDDIFKKAFEIEIILLKMLCLAWFVWLTLQATSSLTELISKFFTNGIK